MAEEKITLDKEVFKTLASGTRVDILKSLDTRRKTLTELSKQFDMSVSTIKEHLDNLVNVGLIEQKDEGHKWKYYELTAKGRDILHPEDKKIWILLGISGVAMIGIGYDLLRILLQPAAAGASLPEAVMRESSDTFAGGAPAAFALDIPYMHVAGLVVFGLLIAAALLYRRKKLRKTVTRI